MDTTRTVNLVAGAVALVAVGLVAWQSVTLRQIETAVARERAGFRAQLEKLETRIAAWESPAAAAPAAAPQGGPAQQADPTEERRRQQALARQRAQEAKARASAIRQFQFSREMQQERFRAFQAEVSARYRPFYRKLGLSTEQVARFEELMAGRYWAYSDVLATRGTPGPAFEEAIFAELSQQALAPIDEGLRTLLGESGVNQYRHYEQMAPAQGLVQAAASRLFDTSEPLSTAQADQLLAILAAHNRRPDALPPGETWLQARISGNDSGATLQWTDIAWDATRQELAGLLSPRQMAAVEALRDQAQARQQAKFLQEEFEREFRSRQNERSAGAPR